jgi:hypothetical protein
MTFERVKNNSPFLWALIVVAGAYLAWQYYWPSFTGDDLFDGISGVVLGLFICSRPASNGIDLLFQERGAFKRAMSDGSSFAWVLLNGLVMLIGWFVITVGAARLTAPRPVPHPAYGRMRDAPQGFTSTSSIAARSGPSIIAARMVPQG